MPQQADPVAARLLKAPLVTSQRASIWQIYQDAVDEDDLAEKLKALQIPNEVKADLWQMKYDGSQRAAPQSEPEPERGGILGTLADVGIGALKGVGNTVVGLGQMAHAIPGVSGAVDALYGQSGLSDAAFADANQRLAPTNTAQQVGKVGEQIVENILPSKLITKAGVALGASMGRPLIGRALAEAGANAGIAAAQQGDPLVAGILGGAMPAVGSVAGGIAKKLAPGSRLSGVEREAVDFARASDIPIDAATATGRPVVQRLQKLASDNIGGAGTAERFKDAQAAALEATGEGLARASNAGGAAVDAVGAGERVRKSLEAVRDRFIGEADKAYSTLRTIENEKHLAVNLKPVKNAMLRTYQELLRESEVAPLMGQKAEALRILDRMMRGPDLETLSVADAALSGLKAFTRQGGALKTPGQGVISGAVHQLDAMVRKAAADGGPAAIKALTDGRAATVAKYSVDDVVESLSGEPRLIYNQLTRQKDAGLETLRNVHKYAPSELPNVGRAYLEEAMGRATAEGGFGHADKLWADWQKLGSETRKLLFPKVALDLDRFFLVAKMIAKNPNPSGTASQLNVAKVLAAVPNWALAKLMYTPAGVRLMTKTIQTGQTNELTAALGRLVSVQGSKVSGGQ